jgi:hypothetical protein
MEGEGMWRSVFLALGIVLCILGAECLVLEKAVMAQDDPQTEQADILYTPVFTSPAAEIKPPEWAAWSLLSTGAVVILYSYSIPRRNG